MVRYPGSTRSRAPRPGRVPLPDIRPRGRHGRWTRRRCRGCGSGNARCTGWTARAAERCGRRLVRFHRRLGGAGTDVHGIRLLVDALHLGEPRDVDEVVEEGEPQRQHRHQALTAGQQLGLVTELPEQPGRLGDAVRAVVIEGRRLHRQEATTGVLSECTACTRGRRSFTWRCQHHVVRCTVYLVFPGCGVAVNRCFPRAVQVEPTVPCPGPSVVVRPRGALLEPSEVQEPSSVKLAQAPARLM